MNSGDGKNLGSMRHGKSLSMDKIIGDSLFPQQDDYKRKYDLLTAYIDGISSVAAESENMSAEQATDAIQRYVDKLNQDNKKECCLCGSTKDLYAQVDENVPYSINTYCFNCLQK